MWVRLGVQNFISKTALSSGGCDVYICDLMRIWHRSLSNDELYSIIRKLNPLFEASPHKLREISLDLFEDEEAQKEIEEGCNGLSVKLQSKKMGVKFQFEVVLNQGDEAMVFKEFTTPLLLTIARNQNKERKLIQIIKEKDAELHEYHQEYAPLKSSYLTTEPFSEKEFERQESMEFESSGIIYSPSRFIDCIHKKLFCMERLQQNKGEESSLNEVEIHHKINNNRLDTKNTLFKDKNSLQDSSFNHCIKPDHKTVKKIRKQKRLNI